MNRGIEIRYGDIAPDAKENFTPTASESEFNTLAQLKQYNLNFPNYGNPCELYSVVLDGNAMPFPSNINDINLGLWSEQISNNDGTFDTPVELELTSDGQYSSQGITLTFDTYNDIYANRLKIKWLRITDEAITTLDEKEFAPDNAFYFCRNKVDNYNKLIITFYSLNMPQNRLKLRVVDYGYGTVFYGDELRNTKLIQEIDPISSQISINTADFSIDSKTNIEYSFQAKQPISIYFNGVLRATTFVKSSKRKSKLFWDVKSEDYVGLMDGVPFGGGMYNGKDAYDLLEEIFLVAKVPYTINANLKGVLLYGYIPYTTCREALMQVAFAVQNVVDTSGRIDVEVFELPEEVSQTIPLERIMQGQSFNDAETVTSVEVTIHAYKAISETVDVYDASESGEGENIFVKFSEPLHDLSIINGEIVTRETNYAIINARVGCILTGQKYEHTTQTRRRNNPVVLANEIEKIVSIENATLVSTNNIDNILEKCYNWLVKTQTINLKIVEGKHVEYVDGSANIITYDKPVNVGEKINADTEYLGVLSGRVIKQSFNLNGNIIIKDTQMK